MRLKGGHLYWPDVSPPPPAASLLQHDEHCDVLVVGSGVSGAMAAHQLALGGCNVIVADQRALCTGSTPASTAMLLYELDTTLGELRERLGPDHARAAYAASYRAVLGLRALIQQLDDDCDLRQRESLYLAARRRDIAKLEVEAANRAAIELPAEFLFRQELMHRFGIDRPAAILSRNAFEVNPVRLTSALLRSAMSRGARCYEHTHINLESLQQRRPFCLTTRCGRAIKAQWVVIATGYETPELFAAIRPLTALTSTFAAVTQPQSVRPWPGSTLLWEHADPYLYARTTTDDRVMFGGEDIPFKNPDIRDQLIARKSRKLLRKLHRLIPHSSFTIESAWAGTFAHTPDGLPLIGPHKQWPGVLFALGYGGNGITFSFLAATIIADAVAERDNQEAHLFAFSRFETCGQSERSMNPS